MRDYLVDLWLLGYRRSVSSMSKRGAELSNETKSFGVHYSYRRAWDLVIVIVKGGMKSVEVQVDVVLREKGKVDC